MGTFLVHFAVRATPSASAIFRQLMPCARSRTTSSRRKIRFGRPTRLPRALAERTPAVTRLRISCRSSSEGSEDVEEEARDPVRIVRIDILRMAGNNSERLGVTSGRMAPFS